MKAYKDWSPTAHDLKGLNCESQQTWLVGPCSVNRDSGFGTESNWTVLNRELDKLDPDGNDHEVHRFGHWGPGWFEIVLVRPGSECEKHASECEAALASYPILDENDWSERESDAVVEYWDTMSLRERVELCSERGECIMAARNKSGIPDRCEQYIRDRIRAD